MLRNTMNIIKREPDTLDGFIAKKIKTENLDDFKGEFEDEPPVLIIQQEDYDVNADVHYETSYVDQNGHYIQHDTNYIEASSYIEHDGTAYINDDGTISGTAYISHRDNGLSIGEGIAVVGDNGVLIDGALNIDHDQNNVIVMQQEETIEEDGNCIPAIEADIENLTSIENQVDISDDMHAALQRIQVPEDGEAEDLDSMLQYQNIIIQHMDIEEPLTTLRQLLEARLQCSLHDHDFYLQDSLRLEPHLNLVSQCVPGSGTVQINVEVISQPGAKPRLNIVDVLKPAEEIEAEPPPMPTSSTKAKIIMPFPEEAENVTRWIVDQNFRKEQERLKIPSDPYKWNEAHVSHWIRWAVKQFSLRGVDIDTFVMNGQQLCDLKHDQFAMFIPADKGDIFWTHLELLRKCKFVAVIQQPTPHAITTITVSTSDGLYGHQQRSFSRQGGTGKQRAIMLLNERSSPGNRTGNNGQIQLWQFLLELLTDKNCHEVIHWVTDDGEFKLSNPEMVAQLWGQRKNKPTMNYEKLSRALRYYYDGDMIAKVNGKRFVYKFVCDLQMLLGYSAAELNKLVLEAVSKNMHRMRDTFRTNPMKR